jgi:hypothetical protein
MRKHTKAKMKNEIGLANSLDLLGGKEQEFNGGHAKQGARGNQLQGWG